jgi:hypothetical protein
MRTSPSIAPHGPDQDTYMVLDDFGSLGRAWRETDERGANRTMLVRNLLDGKPDPHRRLQHSRRLVA